MPGPWNDATDALLKSGRARGVSFSNLSRAVTAAAGVEVSRSACIGRAKRMGLTQSQESRRQTNLNSNLGSRLLERRLRPVVAPLKDLSEVDRAVASPHAKPWEDRERGECAWPIDGGGQPADTLSCCNSCGKEGYCLPHLAVMWPRRFGAAVHRADVKAAANQTTEAA